MFGGGLEDLARVSVIIPVRDDPRLLNCVASVLSRCDEVGQLEVIVVDHLCSAAFRADVLAHLPGPVLSRPGDRCVLGSRTSTVDRQLQE